MNTLEEAFELKQYMINQRNYFHSHPELGLHEFNTCSRIESELNSIGIKYKRISETNIVAEIPTNKPGKTLVLRADIDALPVTEKNEVAYKSQNPGVMHACGHDGHIAYLLGTAKLLLKHINELNGKILLVFQSAEEIGLGARTIIDSGILDSADRFFGIHFQAGMDVGKIAIKSGADMASCDRFKIKIKGHSAHITTPQNGSDSLFIGALIAAQLQTVVSRLISPVEGGLIGIGSFHSGTTYNIIPAEAELEGTIRAFSKESRIKLANAVRKISQNIAEEYGANAEVEILDLSDPCINPPEVALEAVNSAKKIFPTENIITNINKRFGSDNFADFMRIAPGVYIHVGSTDGETTAWPHHNEHFDLSENCYSYAAALAVQYAIDYLS